MEGGSQHTECVAHGVELEGVFERERGDAPAFEIGYGRIQ